METQGQLGDRRLHIAMLTRVTVQHNMGGMELHAEMLRRGFVANGHRVTTITTQLPTGPTVMEDQWGTTYFVGQGAPGMYSPEWWQESVRTFQRIHATDPVDVIASQSGGARACIETQRHLPLEKRVPAVLIMQNTHIDDLQSHLKQIHRHPARALLRWIPLDIKFWRDSRRWLHFADHITVLSKNSAMGLERWYPVNPSQVTVIPNGVDVEAISAAMAQRDDVRRQMGLHDQDTAILILASLVSRKGQRYMLDALASPLLRKYGRSLRLILAGEGPTREKLQNQCARLGLTEQVIFAGPIPHEGVPALLGAADIMALPSDIEGMPLSLLEAMAAERPVVATRVGSIPEFIHDGTCGLLIPPSSPDALARAIDNLLSNPKLAQRLSSAGHDYVLAHHDQRLIVAQCEQVLMRLVADRLKLQTQGEKTPEEPNVAHP